MMRAVKRFFLSRKTILSVIILILASVLLAYLFPQRFTTDKYDLEQWFLDNPALALPVKWFGLDHVFTTPWFAALVAFFLIALCISAYEQIRIAHGRTFRNIAPAGTHILTTPVDPEMIASILKKYSYIRTFQDSTLSRFIRNPWGYWGNVLLHLGIVMIIASSLLITVTEKRGLLHLVEHEVYRPGDPWIIEETGILSDRFILPAAARLDRVQADFWETDDVKNVSTVISLLQPDGGERQHDLGINRAVNDLGLRIYQGRRFGDAFYIELTDRIGAEFYSILQIEHARRRDRPGYGNFFIDGVPFMLKAKYFADAQKKSMDSMDPLLVMRVVTQEKSIDRITPKGEKGNALTMKIAETENIIGEVSLRVGESKPFGPYTAKLVHVSKWSGVIFVESYGMSGIFTGFFIIMVGVSLTYFMPPRDVTVRIDENCCSLSWRAARFGTFYETEFREIERTIKRQA